MGTAVACACLGACVWAWARSTPRSRAARPQPPPREQQRPQQQSRKTHRKIIHLRHKERGGGRGGRGVGSRGGCSLAAALPPTAADSRLPNPPSHRQSHGLGPGAGRPPRQRHAIPRHKQSRVEGLQRHHRQRLVAKGGLAARPALAPRLRHAHARHAAGDQQHGQAGAPARQVPGGVGSGWGGERVGAWAGGALRVGVRVGASGGGGRCARFGVRPTRVNPRSTHRPSYPPAPVTRAPVTRASPDVPGTRHVGDEGQDNGQRRHDDRQKPQ